MQTGKAFIVHSTFLAPAGAQWVTICVSPSVRDKVFFLHLSGTNLQAISQHSVRMSAVSQSAVSQSVSLSTAVNLHLPRSEAGTLVNLLVCLA